MDRRILSDVHKYDEVGVSQLKLADAHQALPETAFKAPLRGSQLPLSSIISHRATADWYPPSSTDECQVHADHALLRWTRQRDCHALLGNRWLSCLLRGGQVLVRNKEAGSPWCFSLGSAPDSASLGWPADAMESNGTTYSTPRKAGVFVVPFLCILDLDDWEALSYEWRSPLWFHTHGMDPTIGVAAVPLDIELARL